jgi:hypothetical protein
MNPAQTNFFAASSVPASKLALQINRSRPAIYSGSMGPALPIANRERANPSSENVSTTVRSSLDSLARGTLRYMISSAASGARLEPVALFGEKIDVDSAGRCEITHNPPNFLQNRPERAAHCAETRQLIGHPAARHQSDDQPLVMVWRRAMPCSPPGRMPPSRAPPSYGYARDLRRSRSGAGATVSLNCSVSVLPASAVVEECPPEITVATASK